MRSTKPPKRSRFAVPYSRCGGPSSSGRGVHLRKEAPVRLDCVGAGKVGLEGSSGTLAPFFGIGRVVRPLRQRLRCGLGISRRFIESPRTTAVRVPVHHSHDLFPGLGYSAVLGDHSKGDGKVRVHVVDQVGVGKAPEALCRPGSEGESRRDRQHQDDIVRITRADEPPTNQQREREPVDHPKRRSVLVETRGGQPLNRDALVVFPRGNRSGFVAGVVIGGSRLLVGGAESWALPSSPVFRSTRPL